MNNHGNKGLFRFYVQAAPAGRLCGGPVIEPKTWNHARLVRRGEEVAVYLNGAAEPIFAGKAAITRPDGCKDVFAGSRCDRFATFEGRVAEVAVFRGWGVLRPTHSCLRRPLWFLRGMSPVCRTTTEF